MKNKTKWLAIVLCLMIFAIMAIGSGSTSSGEDQKISSVSSSSDTEAASSSNEHSTEEASSEISIEDQVIYDANDIKITTMGLDDSIWGTELKLLIENNSSQNITVQARNANVNGYMVSTMMSADVAAGKKANDALNFETSGLKECGIEQMATMEFCFHIFDADSWDDIVDTDVISISTSIAEGFIQNYDDSGEVLVDSNGVRIVGKGLSTDDSFWGPGLILYVENNSKQNITVQVRDVSINGFMVDSSMSVDVVVGKKAISAVQFYSSDLEENGIDDISDIELYFHIFNLDTWDTIFDSDVTSITF